MTFVDLSSAQNALSAEHTIEGRRCEAKVALPKVSKHYYKFVNKQHICEQTRIEQASTHVWEECQHMFEQACIEQASTHV